MDPGQAETAECCRAIPDAQPSCRNGSARPFLAKNSQKSRQAQGDQDQRKGEVGKLDQRTQDVGFRHDPGGQVPSSCQYHKEHHPDAQAAIAGQLPDQRIKRPYECKAQHHPRVMIGLRNKAIGEGCIDLTTSGQVCSPSRHMAQGHIKGHEHDAGMFLAGEEIGEAPFAFITDSHKGKILIAVPGIAGIKKTRIGRGFRDAKPHGQGGKDGGKSRQDKNQFPFTGASGRHKSLRGFIRPVWSRAFPACGIPAQKRRARPPCHGRAERTLRPRACRSRSGAGRAFQKRYR